MRQLTKREAENVAKNMRRRSECKRAEVQRVGSGWKVSYTITVGILFGATFRGEVTHRE